MPKAQRSSPIILTIVSVVIQFFRFPVGGSGLCRMPRRATSPFAPTIVVIPLRFSLFETRVW